MDIRAQIRIRWSKGKTLDSGADRTILLPGLLHVSMTLQDTFRMLMVLALMDGVFGDNIRTWDQLAAFKVTADAATTGQNLPMDPDMRQKYVLRQIEDLQVCNILV
jgi:hypothetical protein